MDIQMLSRPPLLSRFIPGLILSLCLALVGLAPALAQVRVMPFGDSITQGLEGHDSYRRPLWLRLLSGNYNVDFVGSQNAPDEGPPPHTDYDLNHEGHAGWRAEELRDQAQGWASTYQPDIVLLHAGTNDIRVGDTPANTRDELGQIIDRLRLARPNVKVLLAQIIPTTPSNVNDEITDLNALLPALVSQKTTAQSPVILVDQNTGFSATTDLYDGIHPTLAAEDEIAARWYAALQPLLEPVPPGNFTLQLTANGSGTVSKSPSQTSYASGSTVSLTATPGAGQQFSGWSGNASGSTNPLSVTMSANKSIVATFTALPGSGPTVTSYTLVDADSDDDIQTLTTGTTLNLATLPTRNLNIRANTSPATVGSVVFALSGTQSRSQTETLPPYALYSDGNGDYNPWTPAVGSYSLTATPYTSGGGGGSAGTPLTISFSVQDVAPPVSYSLTTNTSGSGTVSKSPNQASYTSGASVTLTATPAAGFQFSAWSGSATGSTNPLSVTMNANKTITATFAPIPGSGPTVTSFTLVNADNDQDIQTLSAGATLNLAALPTRNLNVRANVGAVAVGSVVFALSGTQSRSQTESVAPYALYSDSNSDYNPWTPAVGSYSLTATPYSGGGGGGSAGTPLTIAFTVQDAAVSYSLTTNASGSGSVSKSPNQASYTSGTSVTLTATPTAGQQFSGWSGSATGSTNPLTVSMTANKTITATFIATPVQYSLTVTTAGSGSVAKSPSQATYNSGSSVSLTATAAAGFEFSGWSGDASGSTNPISVMMSADKSITATFTAVVGGPTFYRALNINGGAITLDGRSWEAGNTAPNFSTSGIAFANQNVVLNPATDATRAGMIRSCRFGTDIDAQLRSVPAGTYLVYLYVWEDNDPETFDITVEGQLVQANHSSGAAGHWDRLGPYTRSVNDGTLDINVSGGYANLSGIEVWRQNAAARNAASSSLNGESLARLTSNEAAGSQAPSRAGSLRAESYPNPSATGRFVVQLSQPLQGTVRYTLLSSIGVVLAASRQPLSQPAAELSFDFSEAMKATGLYYLLLEGPQGTLRLKLHH
jgi:lysophospholipase L1-like esterase